MGQDEEIVNKPIHYTSHPSGIECIDIAERLNFNLGNAFKYLWRHQLKGRPTKDLMKSVWYLNREIARISEGEVPQSAMVPPEEIDLIIGYPSLVHNAMVCILLSTLSNNPSAVIKDLRGAVSHVTAYIGEE